MTGRPWIQDSIKTIEKLSFTEGLIKATAADIASALSCSDRNPRARISSDGITTSPDPTRTSWTGRRLRQVKSLEEFHQVKNVFPSFQTAAIQEERILNAKFFPKRGSVALAFNVDAHSQSETTRVDNPNFLDRKIQFRRCVEKNRLSGFQRLAYHVRVGWPFIVQARNENGLVRNRLDSQVSGVEEIRKKVKKSKRS